MASHEYKEHQEIQERIPSARLIGHRELLKDVDRERGPPLTRRSSGLDGTGEHLNAKRPIHREMHEEGATGAPAIFGQLPLFDRAERTQEKMTRLGDQFPSYRGRLADTPLFYPSPLTGRYGVKALTVEGGIHIDQGVDPSSPGDLEAVIAHEAVHYVQQTQGRIPGERGDIEFEANLLAAELASGKTIQPLFRVDPAMPFFDTPQDKVVVENAKKRLTLLKSYLKEWEARQARRVRTVSLKGPLLEKRSKMDEVLPEPTGMREKMESARIENLNRLPLNIAVTEDEVKFKVNFHVRFEDRAMRSRFSDLKDSLLKGIHTVWDQRLPDPVLTGRRFTLEPSVTLISEKATRDKNAWLITVRSNSDDTAKYPGCTLPTTEKGIPTSVTDPTCDGGVMSIPPAHVDKPDILGHETLHLFGLVDRYISAISITPGKKKVVQSISARETGGRPDPLGAGKGTILAEDLAFLFERLGVYAMEESRGLDTLREMERKGMTIGSVRKEIIRLEEIVRLGRDPRSLIRTREDFREKVLRSVEDL